MKRYTPLFFIWLFNFILSVFLSVVCYSEGDVMQFLAWMTASVFAANLLIYHFFVTNGNNK